MEIMNYIHTREFQATKMLKELNSSGTTGWFLEAKPLIYKANLQKKYQFNLQEQFNQAKLL